MHALETIPVQVLAVESVTPTIKRFTFGPCSNDPLPAFSGGSHVTVQLRNGSRIFSNAYSLAGSPLRRDTWQIAVRLEADGRGGSRYLHEQVKVGDTLEVTPPANAFALATDAPRHLLVAGGIGITPFLAQLVELHQSGADYALHYACRDAREAAFADELRRDYPSDRLHFHVTAEGGRLNVAALLAAQPAGTHVYVCGPAGLNEAVLAAARQAGWAEQRIHCEQFHVDATGAAFVAVLAKSGKTIEVAADSSLLQALEGAGVAVPCLCREGVCGTCETAILEGEAEHHDQYLSDEEKAAQKVMMVCVSRARTPRIVLDL